MSRFRTYLRTLGRWLLTPWLAWLAVAITCLFLAIALRPDPTAFHARVAGMLFQWLGIGTVAYGVRQTRHLFGEPSLVDHLRRWLSDFPRWNRRPILGAGGAQVDVQTGNVRLDVWMNITDDDPTDHKLRALLHNTQRLRERLASLETTVDKVRNQHEPALAAESQERKASDSYLATQLHTAHTGGLHITAIGLVWLLLGVLLTSIPQELLGWLADA